MAHEVKTAEQFAAEMKAMQAAAEKASTDAKAEIAELEKKTEAAKAEFKEAKEAAELATKNAAEMTEKAEKLVARMDIKTEPKEGVSLKSAIEETLTKSDFTTGKTTEVKGISTTDFITPIAGGHLIDGLKMNGKRHRPLAFMPEFNIKVVPQDKDTLVYMEATYTSNVKYVGEGTANDTQDAGDGVQKTRELCKISAVLKLTAEMYEDKSYVAQMLEDEMIRETTLWLDKELYSGDGADADGKKNHFFGLATHATAFDATKAGVASSIEKANISDLVDAIGVQGAVVDVAKEGQGGFTINTVWINPSDAMKYRNAKDKNGQYVINKLADGSQVLSGKRVIETTAVPSGKLLAMESGSADLFMKRNFEIKVGQQGNDLTEDIYTIVLFMRGQSLVKNVNKNGVIKVDNIETALASITKVEA